MQVVSESSESSSEGSSEESESSSKEESSGSSVKDIWSEDGELSEASSDSSSVVVIPSGEK